MVAYVACLVAVCLTTLMLELAIGQLSARASPKALHSACPLFKGIYQECGRVNENLSPLRRRHRPGAVLAVPAKLLRGAGRVPARVRRAPVPGRAQRPAVVPVPRDVRHQLRAAAPPQPDHAGRRLLAEHQLFSQASLC